MGRAFFQSLKDYVGFSPRSSEQLQQAYADVAPHVAVIIDDFYATIEAHPGARKAITGGQIQIERLKLEPAVGDVRGASFLLVVPDGEPVELAP